MKRKIHIYLLLTFMAFWPFRLPARAYNAIE